MWLRDRFLSTVSFLSVPDGQGGGENDPPNDPNTSAEGTVAQHDEQSGEGDAAEQGQAEGDDQSGDDSSGEDDDQSGDDDLDLEELPPEIRKKVAKKLERETTWRDRQIDRLYRKNREAQSDNESLRTIAERRAAGEEVRAQPQTPEAVKQAAQQLRMQEKYDEDSNRTDMEGRKAYGDRWAKTLERLPKMGGVDINDMVNILATDHPHAVLYQLGNDPDLYERVMSLPPARRLNEFVKLGLKAPGAASATSKIPSKAPPPVNPLRGNRAVSAQRVSLDDDKVPDDKWYEERNRTRRRKFSNVE